MPSDQLSLKIGSLSSRRANSRKRFAKSRSKKNGKKMPVPKDGEEEMLNSPLQFGEKTKIDCEDRTIASSFSDSSSLIHTIIVTEEESDTPKNNNDEDQCSTCSSACSSPGGMVNLLSEYSDLKSEDMNIFFEAGFNAAAQAERDGDLAKSAAMKNVLKALSMVDQRREKIDNARADDAATDAVSRVASINDNSVYSELTMLTPRYKLFSRNKSRGGIKGIFKRSKISSGIPNDIMLETTIKEETDDFREGPDDFMEETDDFREEPDCSDDFREEPDDFGEETEDSREEASGNGDCDIPIRVEIEVMATCVEVWIPIS